MSARMGQEIWFCPVGEAFSPEGIAPQLPKIQNIMHNAVLFLFNHFIFKKASHR